MKRINIRESLIQMDRDTSCKYDLTTMYESVSLTEDKKKELVKYIDAYDIDATNKFLGNEVSSQGLTEFYDDDFSDDLSYYYSEEDIIDALNDVWEEIASKSVSDSDGFMTDYTMYRNINTGEYVFVFGDKDIYRPEDGYFDHVEEDVSAAEEWFNSYQGLIEGDDMWEKLQSLEDGVDFKSANDDTEDKVIDESVNFNLEEIKAVVGGKVSDYLHNELGYGNDFINDYVFVEVTPSDNDRVKVEVRAELGYEELSNLGEVLNNIISTYDSNAYFEPETTGILVAYIGNEDDKGEIDYDTVNRVSDKLNATKSFDELKQVYETEIVPNRDNWSRSTLDVIYTVVDELIDTYKNNESIDENLCESSNVQFGVHQFSTNSIIFRGTEEECGKYIDKHKELWDDAEVYMMTPDDPHYKRTDESLNESILNPNRLFQWAVGILFDMDRFVMDVYDNESWLTYGVGDGEFEETTTQEAKDNYTEHDWLVTDIDTNEFSVEDFTDFLNAFKSATSNKSDYDQVERQNIISEAEDLLDTVKMSNKQSVNESKSIKENVEYKLKSDYYYDNYENLENCDFDEIIEIFNNEGWIDCSGNMTIPAGTVLTWVGNDHYYDFYEVETSGGVKRIPILNQDNGGDSMADLCESFKPEYWYFTKHGVQPGSIPKGANVLTIQDVENGTYVKLDRVLTTKELNDYEIIEKRPEGLDESKSIKESGISEVEPVVKFKGKSSHTFTPDKKWEVDFDEEGNVLARTRQGKPYYFSGHINDKTNEFGHTDEDAIIQAAREQHKLKFGKLTSRKNESKSIKEAANPQNADLNMKIAKTLATKLTKEPKYRADLEAAGFELYDSDWSTYKNWAVKGPNGKSVVLSKGYDNKPRIYNSAHSLATKDAINVFDFVNYLTMDFTDRYDYRAHGGIGRTNSDVMVRNRDGSAVDANFLPKTKTQQYYDLQKSVKSAKFDVDYYSDKIDSIHKQIAQLQKDADKYLDDKSMSKDKLMTKLSEIDTLLKSMGVRSAEESLKMRIKESNDSAENLSDKVKSVLDKKSQLKGLLNVTSTGETSTDIDLTVEHPWDGQWSISTMKDIIESTLKELGVSYELDVIDSPNGKWTTYRYSVSSGLKESIKESLRPSVLKELNVQDASVKDFENLSETDYVVTRYYFHQYAGGVNGSNRDYSVFFGFKDRREALDFRNNHIEFFKSFVKRGKDTPYGEIGATSVKTQVVRKGQVKEPYGCYPNYFKVISTQVQTDEPLKEDYSDEVVTLSRYLDVEVPDICSGVLDLIEHLPSHKISYAAKICRDFYANMESIIKGYVMTGNNFDESLQKDETSNECVDDLYEDVNNIEDIVTKFQPSDTPQIMYSVEVDNDVIKLCAEADDIDYENTDDNEREELDMAVISNIEKWASNILNNIDGYESDDLDGDWFSGMSLFNDETEPGTYNGFTFTIYKDEPIVNEGTDITEDFYPNEGGTPEYAQYKYDTEHKEPRTFPLDKFGTEEDIDDLRNNTDYYVNRYDIKLSFTDSTFTVSGPDSDRFIRDYKLDECISENSSNDDVGCE